MADTFKLFAVVPTVTSKATVLTVASESTVILRGLVVCNGSTSSTVACDVLVTPAGGSDTFLARIDILSPFEASQPINDPVVLSPGSALKVQASTADLVNIVGSYLEVE